MRDAVEVSREVRINDVCVPGFQGPVHLLHGLQAALPGTVSIGIVSEVRLEDGLKIVGQPEVCLTIILRALTMAVNGPP